ncbi:MAG: hypothetical protein WD046_04520 [Paracoccaceae bacterium]
MSEHILAFALAVLPAMAFEGDATGTWRTATGDTGAYLHVEGCVAIFCRGQDWTRAD